MMKMETKMNGRGPAKESFSGFLRHRSIPASLAQESILFLSVTRTFLDVHDMTANCF